jgi:hypothetical protein
VCTFIPEAAINNRSTTDYTQEAKLLASSINLPSLPVTTLREPGGLHDPPCCFLNILPSGPNVKIIIWLHLGTYMSV